MFINLAIVGLIVFMCWLVYQRVELYGTYIMLQLTLSALLWLVAIGAEWLEPGWPGYFTVLMLNVIIDSFGGMAGAQWSMMRMMRDEMG